MKVYIGSDHAGFDMKQWLKKALVKEGYGVVDCGAKTKKPKDDYPDYAFKVGEKIARYPGYGLLVCGSAQGVCIAANKVSGVRAIVSANQRDAKLAREHNDANVLCLSGWTLAKKKALGITLKFLKSDFSGDLRHARRIAKISKYEGSN
jgi:ribose 5-phosphate isomerase B